MIKQKKRAKSKTKKNKSEKYSKNKEKVCFTGVCFNVKINNNDSESEQPEPQVAQRDELIGIGSNFTTVLQMLWKYINSIGNLAEATSAVSFGTLKVLLDEIKQIEKQKKGKPIAELELEPMYTNEDGEKKNAKPEKYKIFDYSHLEKVLTFKEHNQAALSILHETAIQQMVNAWEKLLADILSWFYKYNQDKITKEEKISYNKILQFSNLDEVKKTVIDAEVKKFLSQTTKEQIKFINDIFKINFQSIYKKNDSLHELIFTRHLIVHYGGVVTNEYLNSIKNLKDKKIPNCTLGKKVEIHPGFIIASWGVVYIAGVMLTHSILRKTFTPKDIETDNFLNNSAYLSIKENQLDSAIALLEYANSLSIQDTKMQWTAKLNLAQAYKYNGEEEKFKKIIDSGEWDVANDLFLLCHSSLKEDVEKFQFYLKEVAKKGMINVTELYEWPIFHYMRQQKDFNKWIEESFGYKLDRISELFNQKVIDNNPAGTMKQLVEFWDNKK